MKRGPKKAGPWDRKSFIAEIQKLVDKIGTKVELCARWRISNAKLQFLLQEEDEDKKSLRPTWKDVESLSRISAEVFGGSAQDYLPTWQQVTGRNPDDATRNSLYLRRRDVVEMELLDLLIKAGDAVGQEKVYDIIKRYLLLRREGGLARFTSLGQFTALA